MSEDKCKACGQSTFGRSKYTLVGFVTGIVFSIMTFTLGYYYQVNLP